MKDITRRKRKHLRRDLRADDTLCTKKQPVFLNVKGEKYILL
ncbi:hypothetical protein MY9_1894 [Bacillus sp. JS]|nr:hypothetical protein MY9_1894 [Bacillus sp. JS]